MNKKNFIDDVIRISPKKVRLNWRTETPHQHVKIYMGNTPDLSLIDKTLMSSTTETSIEFDISNDNRCYFLFEINHHYYITAERVLPLDGANNFRDIGGYINTEGRVVKWGKLYRSDHLHNLSDRDLSYLNTMGFHSIVDYRNEKEYSQQPNRIWNDHSKTFHLIPDASSAELAAKASNDHEKIQELICLTQNRNSGTIINGSGYIMQEQNRDFVRNPDTAKVYRELIDIILDTNNISMVQHCRGGKDRTGFGIAIILAILDVSSDLILNDYAMTGKLRYSRNIRRMNEYKKETNNQDILDFLYSMMETRNDYLQSAFDEMEKIYGSIDGYLEKSLKLTDREKNKIKQIYLY